VQDPVTAILALTDLRSGAHVHGGQTQISNDFRPPCSRCGKPLLLTLHQPASPGFEFRIYYCASCAASDRVIAPRAAAAQGFRRSPNLC